MTTGTAQAPTGGPFTRPSGGPAYLPVSVFATVMGLGGTALAWQRAAGTFAMSPLPGRILAWTALTAFAVTGTAYATKAFRQPSRRPPGMAPPGDSALRFKTDADDVFQHPAPYVPKLIALPALLYTASAVAQDEPDNNPNPELAAQRVTTVGGATGPADEINALLVYAESVGLSDNQARTILREVAEAAENWDSIARRNGITQTEIARFEPTLSHTIDAVRVT